MVKHITAFMRRLSLALILLSVSVVSFATVVVPSVDVSAAGEDVSLDVLGVTMPNEMASYGSGTANMASAAEDYGAVALEGHRGSPVIAQTGDWSWRTDVLLSALLLNAEKQRFEVGWQSTETLSELKGFKSLSPVVLGALPDT